MDDKKRKKRGRAITQPERITLPMPAGTKAAIDAVRGDETRVGYIRAAIFEKLGRRGGRHG